MFYYSSTDLNEEGVTSFPPLNLMERNGQLPPQLNGEGVASFPLLT